MSRHLVTACAALAALAFVACSDTPPEQLDETEDLQPADAADGEADLDTAAADDEPPDEGRVPQPGEVLPGKSLPDDLPPFSDVITIEGRTFTPDDLLVGAEREMRVVNLDDEAHTLTAFDGSFDVEVGPGETVEFLTPEPGAYPYWCSIHPEMGAEIDVM